MPASLLAWSFHLREKTKFICFAEQIALASPYFSSIASQFRGRKILHAADNKAANYGAVRGYSKCPDMCEVVYQMHMQGLRLGSVSPWIEYVPSKANLSDEPSRGVFRFLSFFPATQIEFAFPPLPGWNGVLDTDW